MEQATQHIITLTTDWGNSDNYASIFKAHLYRENPNAKVIDVTHDVKKNALIDAAFLIKITYSHFPQNSIHIIDVNYLSLNNEKILKAAQSPENLNFTHYLAFYYDNHYFMCENNGIVSLLCNINEIKEIVRIFPDETYNDFRSFKAIPYWVKVASKLTNGDSLLSVGEKYDLKQIEPLNTSKVRHEIEQHEKRDKIIFYSQYIDSYGNIITNLHKNFFDKIANGRTTFHFYCTQTGTYKNRKISTEYNDKSDNQFLLLFGHSQYLEIATKYASFAKIFRSELSNIEFTIIFPPKIKEE
jgi:S-adenosylmethionine hydrolase